MTGQLEFPVMKARKAPDTMADALAWIEANHAAWRKFVAICRSDVRFFGRANVKGAIERIRYQAPAENPRLEPVKLPNAYSSAFGRILVAWYPDDFAEAIVLHGSKLDGCVIPPRPLWTWS